MDLIKVPFKESTQTDYLYNEETFSENSDWVKIVDLFNKNFLNKEVSTNKIPKIIHQIWLGSEFPQAYKEWQSSWLKYNPGWEYLLWTEKEANEFEFDNKEIYNQTTNFGAKSDILRYAILKKYGGMYIDTDFECLHNFDSLHSICDFYTGLIYSKEPYLGNGIIGCIPNHPIMDALCTSLSSSINEQTKINILNNSGPGKFTACVFANAFDENYINIIFPVTYFYPFPNNKLHIQNPKKKKKYYKKETLAVHHWEVSWTKTSPFKKITSKILRYIPPQVKNKIKIKLKKIFQALS